MEIQVRRGNRRKHYTSFCKVKIVVIIPEMVINGIDRNIFISYCTTELMHNNCQASPCLDNHNFILSVLEPSIYS